MRSVVSTITFILKRPITALLFSVFTFIFCILEQNVIVPLFSTYTTASNANIYESTLHLIQLLFTLISNMLTTPLNLIKFLILIILFSGILGTLMSGYLFIVDVHISKIKRNKNDFFKGLKNYFFKMFSLIFISIITFIIFMLFILVSSVPALLFNALTVRDNHFSILSIFINLITGMVILSLLILFRMYILYWYPATMKLSNTPKRILSSFSLDKRIVNKNFASIFISILLFDIVFILSEVVLLSINNTSTDFYSNIILISNWIFKTLLLNSFLIYIFSSFKRFSCSK